MHSMERGMANLRKNGSMTGFAAAPDQAIRSNWITDRGLKEKDGRQGDARGSNDTSGRCLGWKGR